MSMENDDNVTIHMVELVLNHMKEHNITSIAFNDLQTLFHDFRCAVNTNSICNSKEEYSSSQKSNGPNITIQENKNVDSMDNDASYMNIDDVDMSGITNEMRRTSISSTHPKLSAQNSMNVNDLQSNFVAFNIGSTSQPAKTCNTKAKKPKANSKENNSGNVNPYNSTVSSATSESVKFSFTPVSFDSKSFSSSTFTSPWSQEKSEPIIANTIGSDSLPFSPSSPPSSSLPNMSNDHDKHPSNSTKLETEFDDMKATPAKNDDVFRVEVDMDPRHNLPENPTSSTSASDKIPEFNIGVSSDAASSKSSYNAKKAIGATKRGKAKKPSSLFASTSPSTENEPDLVVNWDSPAMKEFGSFSFMSSSNPAATGGRHTTSSSSSSSRESHDMNMFPTTSSASSSLPSEGGMWNNSTPADMIHTFPQTSSSTSSDSQSTDNPMSAVADMYRKQGRDLYASEDYPRALEAYEKALQQAPTIWPPRVIVCGNRAATLMMLGRFTDAVDVCNEAIQYDTNAAKIYCRKGRALIRLGHLSEATAAFQTAVEKTSYHNSISNNSNNNIISENKKTFKEAMDHLNIISTLNKLIVNIPIKEADGYYYGVLQLTTELLNTCTHHRPAQLAHARAMMKLKQFVDAKSFIEEITVTLPVSMHKLYAHPCIIKDDMASNAAYHIPTTSQMLSWSETAGYISMNIINIVQAMLCMGSELAELYTIALKNQPYCRTHCTEVMTHIKNIYAELQNKLDHHNITSPASPDRSGRNTGGSTRAYDWIKGHHLVLENIMSNKSRGDTYFRVNNFSQAVSSYTLALGCDTEAMIWNAILLSNRAAANMSMKRYSEALHDCNEALKRDNLYYKAQLRRARLHQTMNKLEASIRDYEEYLQHNDSNGEDRSKIAAELSNVRSMLSAKNNPEPTSTHSQYHRSSSSRSHDSNTSYNMEFDENDWDEIFGAHSSFFQPQPPRRNTAKPSPRTSNMRKDSSPGASYDHHTSYSRPQYNPSGHTFRPNSNPNPSDRRRPYGSGKQSYSSSSSSSNQRPSSASSTTSSGEVDLYTVLNVPAAATDREITLAYRRLALQYHPDKNKDPSAEDKFKSVTSAYSVLSDKTSRYRYDLTRPY